VLCIDYLISLEGIEKGSRYQQHERIYKLSQTGTTSTVSMQGITAFLLSGAGTNMTNKKTIQRRG
jgi:hypothetical protein